MELQKPLLIIVLAASVALSYVVGFRSNTVPQQEAPNPWPAGYPDGLEEKIDDLLQSVASNSEKIRQVDVKNHADIERLYKKLDGIKPLEKPNALNQSVDAEPQSDMNESTPSFEQYLAQQEQAFASEIVDFTWAPDAERDLESGLAEMAEAGNFDLMDYQCRTTRCSATVAFENYDLAVLNGNRLAEAEIPGLNCAQSIALPSPGDPSARYQANLLLDCSDQVQGKVQPYD